MAVSGMFLIFTALENLFVQTIEDQSKGILVNGGCATISKHDIDKVVEASLLCDLITFALQHVRLEVKNVKWANTLTSKTSYTSFRRPRKALSSSSTMSQNRSSGVDPDWPSMATYLGSDSISGKTAIHLLPALILPLALNS